jgi:hypothetical protein
MVAAWQTLGKTIEANVSNEFLFEAVLWFA